MADPAYARFDDRQLFAFMADSEEKALAIMADRADSELPRRIPVFAPSKRKPLSGQRGHWSPPGNLRASYRLEHGTDIENHRYFEVVLDRSYRFSRKHRHAIPSFVEKWLAEQVGREL